MAVRRILIESPRIWGGGGETLLQSIVEYFIRDYCFTVLTRPDQDDVFPASADPNVHWLKRRTEWLPYDHGTPVWLANRIMVKAENALFGLSLSAANYDVAIAMLEGYAMRHLSRIRAKQKLGWVQCDFRDFHVSKAHFDCDRHELECMKRFDKIVCVSEAARRGVIETIGDPGNLCVRYNPIDVRKIRHMAQEPCEADAREQRPLIVSVGRLHEVKNYPVLLRACNELAKEIAFDLWIIGDGPERGNLENLIREAGMINVRLLGARDNPYKYMSRADLFVSASFSEAYGLAIQESLILGTPVVAVRNPGVSEALDEQYGILTENSVEALKAAIRSMLCDEVLRNRYRENIAENYPAETLYSERFEAIRELWTQND